MKIERLIQASRAVLLAGALLTPSLALASESPSGDVEELRAEVSRLRAEVSQVRAQNGETWLNERRAEEVKALVKEVLSDADTRASLLDNNLTAGHNGRNFFLASEDGSFLLKVAGQVQVRYIANFRNKPTGAATTPDDGNEDGFQIRRARLVFDGHIGSPKWEYQIQATANRDTSALEIEKAYIAYGLTDSVKIGAGRYKENFLRESYISDGKQLAVERSLVEQVFGTGYVEGLFAEVQPTQWLQLSASVTDGQRSGDPGGSSTGYLNGGNDFYADATDLAVTGRADVKLAGDWKQADDFAAWSGQPFALFVGGGVHYELAETGDTQASGTTGAVGPYDDFVTYSVDGLAKVGGLGIYAAFIGQHIDATDANARGNLDNHGALVQAGYFVIPDKLEPFARYEWLAVDDALHTNDLNLVTVGANYYFRKHAARISVDAVWALNNINSANTLDFAGPSGTGLSGLGLLADAPNRENQVVVRAQIQLLF